MKKIPNKKKTDASIKYLDGIEKGLEYNIKSYQDAIGFNIKRIETATKTIENWRGFRENFLKLRETFPKLQIINPWSLDSIEFLNIEKFSIDSKKEKFLLNLDPYSQIVAVRRYFLTKIDDKSVRIFKDKDYVPMFSIVVDRYDHKKRAYPWKVRYNTKHWDNILQHSKSKKIIKYLIDFDANQLNYSLNITWENVPARIQKLMNFS